MMSLSYCKLDTHLQRYDIYSHTVNSSLVSDVVELVCLLGVCIAMYVCVCVCMHSGLAVVVVVLFLFFSLWFACSFDPWFVLVPA